MSRNHREPVKPVESEESGEDDDAESEEESDSEPEPTPAQKNAAKPQQTPTPTPQPPPSSSEEEEESGETDSESDEEESKLQQPPSKPVEKSSNGAKNGRSKPNASVPATPTKAVVSKRSAAEDASTPKGSKKAKTNDGETSEKKSFSFPRVFTEDDELVILEGLNDYRSENHVDPVTNLVAFYEYIKGKLQANLSNGTQLQSKIKRLKKKFLTNNDIEKVGKLKLLANSRDQKLYELSKLFWGNVNQNGVEGSQKARRAAKKTPAKKATATSTEEVKNVKNAVVVGVKDVKNVAFVGELKKLILEDGASMEEMMLKTGRKVYEAGEGIEGEDEWRKLRVEELKLYIKQLEVSAAQAKLVLGVMKPQDH